MLHKLHFSTSFVLLKKNHVAREMTITEKEVIEAPVRHVLINQQALGAFDAATQKLHEVFVLDSADQIHLVEELIDPLPRIVDQSFNSYCFTIRKRPLEHRTASPLPDFSRGVEIISGLFERFVLELQARVLVDACCSQAYIAALWIYNGIC